MTEADETLRQLLQILRRSAPVGRPSDASRPSTIDVTPTVELPIDTDSLRRVAADADPGLVRQLTAASALPQHLRSALADHPDWRVRAEVGELTDDPEVHRLLLDDPDPRVQALASRSRSTTEADLRHLAGHRRYEVRAAVATDPRTPAEVLRVLARDRSTTVRLNLITFGPGAHDPEILESLTVDPDPGVASQARGLLFQRHEHRAHGHPLGVDQPGCARCEQQRRHRH